MRKNSNKPLTKIDDLKSGKMNVFFKKSILKTIMKILLMEHSGFRTFKSIKNINRVFANMDLSAYKGNQELQSYVWCISFISKKWLDGLVNIDLVIEACKRDKEYDTIKGDVIQTCYEDPAIVTEPEAKMIFSLISEALQFGFLNTIKDEYLSLLDDIQLDNPGAFKQLADRLFLISQSVIDIKHNTNFIANKVTFNSSDPDSIKGAISQTIDSLSASNNIFKVGIRRWNTLLSPGYMNGRLYIYAGPPGSGKSLILLKSALDIRKYNPDYKTKTPGMKACVLYITMENSFTETIERLWNMTFQDSITNYTPDEAFDMLGKELGFRMTETDHQVASDGTEVVKLQPLHDENIELVIKYFSYREISTDDLFTIIQDLRDENLEVCALVLDYIKRIEPNVPVADNVKLELDRVMNELKALAVIQDIPVISAHQLNRMAASVIDGAIRAGKGDALKLAGREHIGSAYEVVEVADFVSLINMEYKKGTSNQYMTMSVVKRRRIDDSAGELARHTYLAHPFAKDSIKLIDDVHLDKVLSLLSLETDISEILGKDKVNATSRLNILPSTEFEEDQDY